MDIVSVYIKDTQRAAASWVEELCQRTRHPWKGNIERRFVCPLFDALPTANAQLHTNTSLVGRIAAAALQSQVLFDQALRVYSGDFAHLYNKTAQVIAHNALEHGTCANIFDPTMLQTWSGMQHMLLEMWSGATKESSAYASEKSAQLVRAFCSGDLAQVAEFWERQVAALDIVVNQNPRAMTAIKAEMGCQFDDARRFVHIAETTRAVLYQVLPLQEGVVVRAQGKPIIHKAPFILPENILDLLPGHGLSYVGAFANSGTPTYFMHMKPIMETVAVQLMSEEDLLLDLQFFAQKVHALHGRKATVNGTCQGALPLLHGVCSAALRLDRDVDVWIGTVPAYALSQSKRVAENLRKIPTTSQELSTITERLPSGNVVVSGLPASLAARLNDPRKENPVSTLIRDMKGAERGQWSPMVAALRRYLKTIGSMPLSMTAMSQRCATTPITQDGVFPEILFGEPLSFHHAINGGVKLHVVAGEKDEVVDLGAALAMFALPCVKNYSGASCHVIPGAGHVAPMTTCTAPTSQHFIGNTGGPLWCHLQQEAGTVSEA